MSAQEQQEINKHLERGDNRPASSQREIPIILMATCNGARFVSEQIQSIQRQSARDWTLLVRDDASADNTPEILQSLATTDSRIRIVKLSRNRRLGVSENFNLLLRIARRLKRNVIFLCDQDDVWEINRLAVQSASVAEKETPALSFCRTITVDHNLSPLRQDMAAHDKNGMPGIETGTLLTMNTIPGCTMCLNRRLLEVAYPVPSECRHHDWWIALVAATAGVLIADDSTSIAYRQHTENVIGGASTLQLALGFRKWPEYWLRGQRDLTMSTRQAGILHGRLSDNAESSYAISAPALDALLTYSRLPTLPVKQRLKAVRRLGLRRGAGFARLVLLVRLLFIEDKATRRRNT